MTFFEALWGFISRVEAWGPIVAIGAGFVAYKIFTKVSKKIIFRGKNQIEMNKRKTIIALIKNTFKWVFIVIVVLVILGIFGVDTRGLVAGLGIMGLIIGLGLQDTIRDLISGLTIITDNHFMVGDTIMQGNFKGEVICIGLRTTTIRSYSGETLFIANRTINSVVNFSQTNSQIVFEVITPYEEDLNKTEKIFLGLGTNLEKIKNVIKNKTEYLGVKDITGAGVKHMLKLRCKRLTYYQVKREAIKVIKQEFDQKKIKIQIT